MPNKTSSQKLITNQRYDQEHTETLGLKFKKGVKANLKAVAERSGKSLTVYFVEAMTEKAIKDGILTPEQAETILIEDKEGKWLKAYNSETSKE